MKALLLCITCLLLLSCQANDSDFDMPESESEIRSAAIKHFHQSIDSVLALLPSLSKKHHLNDQYVIIANLGIHSGLQRMVLLDVYNKKIIDSGCVAHGYGKAGFSKQAVFSNIPDSYCSSEGKYRIGEKYNGRFGKSYKLYGLDKSNSNASKRAIVLHAYECVTDNEIYPGYTCNSQGCPMISALFLTRLSVYVDKSNKPILLWILSK